jgi:hypothetical protein
VKRLCVPEEVVPNQKLTYYFFVEPLIHLNEIELRTSVEDDGVDAST